MPELLDDYCKAEFPLVIKQGPRFARLLGTIGGRVVGYTFHTREVDGEVVEIFSVSLDWNGDGTFSDGLFPDMNLPAPPAKRAERLVLLENEKASAQGRLDAMPDAPPEWRGIDERRILQINEEIAILKGYEA